MNLNVILLRAATRSRDWTSQELAEFYRVEASLVQASIPIETDRGRSDEGDPWFVFCHANTGDVIIHFACIDGVYVVESPALGGCVRGHNFRSLIEAQIESHPLVIPRRKGGLKLSIHPAALLIALVTMCFFKLSQHNGALAAEINEARQGASSGFSHTNSASHALVLDERATATVLAAIAAGVNWADGSGRATSALHSWATSQSDATWHGPAFSASADTLDTLTTSERRLLHPIAQEVEPPSTAPEEQSTMRALPQVDNDHLASNGADGQLLFYSLQTLSVYSTSVAQRPVMLQNGGDFAAANTSTHASENYAALDELVSVLGWSVQRHFVAVAPDNPTQQAVNHASSALQNTEPATTSMAPTTQIATDTSSHAISAVDAIDAFVAAHPNFQVILEQDEIIMYDPSLTPRNISNASEQTFAFSDGSSVILIGLSMSHMAAAHAAFHF